MGKFAVKYSFVKKFIQSSRKDPCEAELTLPPRSLVKPLMTKVTAIACVAGARLKGKREGNSGEREAT